MCDSSRESSVQLEIWGGLSGERHVAILNQEMHVLTNIDIE